MSDHKKVRFERLRVVLKLAVEQTVKRLMGPDQMKDCFPKIATMEGGEATLELARKQVADYFVNTSLSQFDHICQERNLEFRLNDLDEIIQNAQHLKTTNSGPQIHVDQLSAEELVDSAVVQSKLHAVEQLQLVYDQLCLENAQLYKELSSRTRECETLKNSVLSLVDSLQSGIDETKRLNFEHLLERLAEETFGE